MNQKIILTVVFVLSMYSITATAQHQKKHSEIGLSFNYIDETYDNGGINERDTAYLTGVYLDSNLSENFTFLTKVAMGNGTYSHESYANDLEYDVLTFNFGGNAKYEFNDFLDIMLTFYYQSFEYHLDTETLIKSGLMASPSLLFKFDEHVSISTGITKGITGNFLNNDISQDAVINIENDSYRARLGASFTVDTYSIFFSIGMKF